MINKKALLAGLLTASVLVAVPITSFAEGNCNRGYDNQQMSPIKGDRKGGHKGGKHGMMRIDRMAQKLGLSEEQKTEIQLIIDNSREGKDSLREQMIENRQALHALDTASADYAENVEEIASTIATLEKDKVVNQSAIRQQIDAVLTVEQKAEMAEMKENMGKRKGKYKN